MLNLLASPLCSEEHKPSAPLSFRSSSPAALSLVCPVILTGRWMTCRSVHRVFSVLCYAFRIITRLLHRYLCLMFKLELYIQIQITTITRIVYSLTIYLDLSQHLFFRFNASSVSSINIEWDPLLSLALLTTSA